jgi:putative ABC transport system permease protein
MMNWTLAIRLGLADLWAERVLALCTMLALAAVLAPLIVLAGLRAGVVQGLRQLLLEDPHAREIVTAANRSLPATLLAGLAARPDVAFLAPRTRTLAASLLLEQPDGPGDGVRVELIPTGPGDPLLPGAPVTADAVILSTAAAARLHAVAGQKLTGRLARSVGGRRETMLLDLTAQSIAPPSAFRREAAFVTLPLAVFVEDFQDGRADQVGSLAQLRQSDRTEYAGFRLYAARLEDVPVLDAALLGQGIEVADRAGDVEGILRVDRNLTLLFAVVAGLGGSGFLVSLGAGLWANVERKRVPLALLRFLGLQAGALRVFPMIQAAMLAVVGALAALAVALATSVVINRAFAGMLALDRPLCLIDPAMGIAALLGTVGGAVLVAAAAATRAARIEPWEGVRPA